MSEKEPFIARGRSLLAELLRMAQTRLEILAIEIEQEKLRISRALRLAIATAVFAWLAGFSLVLWVALALAPRQRFIFLGALFVAFLLCGIGSFLLLRRALARNPLFARLRAQLHLDRASLGHEP